MWSTVSCALTLACWPYVSKKKKKKTSTLRKYEIHLHKGPAITAQDKNRGLGSDLGQTEFGDHRRVISQRRREKHSRTNTLVTLIQD